MKKMSSYELVADFSYLNIRLETLGIKESQNILVLKNGDQLRIFDADASGDIIIRYFTLDRRQYSFKKPGNKFPQHFERIRFKRPLDDHKYNQPKGSPQFPFFPPSIIEKYESNQKIDCLFIVEGEFKAFKGSLVGLDIIGIPSIHGFYSSEIRGKLNEDIERLILKCNVKKLVLVSDADTLTVKWAQGKDLSKRASSFYSSVKNFRQSVEPLLANPVDIVGFCHIQKKYFEDAKGLDDLFSKYTALQDRIVADLKMIHLASEFFNGFLLNDINIDLKKVFNRFGLASPSEFYETYTEFIGDKEFVYRGRTYQWSIQDSKLNEVKDEVPYVRVGVKYYKKVYTPLADGGFLLNLKEWTRSCIEMDHGREYLKKIERFEDWCYIPDHIEFRQSVNGFYNRYYPLNHIPAPGNCDNLLNFIKHIFGEHYEKGLDYMQLLYTKPRQVLPVLCLVSQSRNTGKTTFLNLLTNIFGRNATINRNEDFESQFNSGWAGKLIIAVDETFIDRKKIYERIKSLSTGKTMKVEAKGQDSTDAEFFGKVILCSNNEDTFIPVDENEIRFWIRKINSFGHENPNLLNMITPEIPAFLQMLLDRKISTEQKTRMWFDASDIQTEALLNIVSKNKTYLEKELLEILCEIISEFDLDEVKFTLTDLQSMLTKSSIREPLFKIRDLVTKKWKLEVKNSSYIKYIVTDTGDKNSFNAKGKYFTFNRELVGLPMRNILNINDSIQKSKVE